MLVQVGQEKGHAGGDGKVKEGEGKKRGRPKGSKSKRIDMHGNVPDASRPHKVGGYVESAKMRFSVMCRVYGFESRLDAGLVRKYPLLASRSYPALISVLVISDEERGG